jgi:hypothetical protein
MLGAAGSAYVILVQVRRLGAGDRGGVRGHGGGTVPRARGVRVGKRNDQNLLVKPNKRPLR